MSIMTGSPAQAPAAPPAVVEALPGQNSRQRLLLLAGGGLALVVVAALAYFFLLSGGSSTPVGSAALPAAGSGASPSASASASAPAVAPLKSFAGKTARNPFKVLVSTTPAGSTGSTGTTSGTATGTTSGTATGTTAGTDTTTVAPTSSVPLQVTLKSITGTSSASVWVYNTSTKKTAKYAPKIGESFGTYFRLTGFVSATNGAKGALVEYGDVILTLVTNQTSTVK